MWFWMWLACTGPADDGWDVPPEPDAWGEVEGPGGPSVTFTEEELWEPCAYLTGGPEDVEHHNLVGMYDGYLFMPWAPEDGGGGITVFDFHDPCDPVKVGEKFEPTMRESHTLSFGTVNGRDYLAVDYHLDRREGGIGFWDVTDRSDPVWVSSLALPSYNYPDAYFRVALSTFWQGDLLYVSSGVSGIFVVDVSDPTAPELLHQHAIVAHLVGSFHLIGNVGMASSAGVARTVLYDMSDPLGFEAFAGGDFYTTDREGELANYYFANVGGEYGLFARNSNGGGPILYDIRDPEAPVWVSDHPTEDGDGAYIFRHEDLLFQGDSNFGSLYDMSNPEELVELGRFELRGDLDTVTPIGNVAVVSVDEKGEPGMATSVVPWREAPDTRGPEVKHHVPGDGEAWVALTGRIGLSLDEQIEPRSAFAGSVRVWDQNGTLVPGNLHVQESIVNFTPSMPLSEATTYFVEVPAGGLTDVSGNPVTTALRFAFATGEEVLPWP